MAVLVHACKLCRYRNKKGEANTEEPKDSTFAFVGNPIVKNKFTADPAPMVHDGRLYLYVGHDEYYAVRTRLRAARSSTSPNGCATLLPDMKEWTDHGVVLRPSDFAWSQKTREVGDAWASQVVERDGKFYYYTTLQGNEEYPGYAVGVAVSDSPTGPFVDAIGKPLVSDDMTDNGKRGWWNDIDPTVLIDGDDAWLCWGNGTCFLAKLKPNMIEIDGDIKVVDVPRYVEGPWLHKRGDIYYLTYASIGNGGETIAYATPTVSMASGLAR